MDKATHSTAGTTHLPLTHDLAPILCVTNNNKKETKCKNNTKQNGRKSLLPSTATLTLAGLRFVILGNKGLSLRLKDKNTKEENIMETKHKLDHTEITLPTADDMRELDNRPKIAQKGREFTITPEQDFCPRGCQGHLYWNKKEEDSEGYEPSKHCYQCNEDWIVDGEDDIQKLERDFKDALNTGTQDEVLRGIRAHLRETFSLEPDFFEEPSNEVAAQALKELSQEGELKHDELNDFATKTQPMAQQTKNFLVLIRKRYVPVAQVKAFAARLDHLHQARDRALVWATWKGFQQVHYASKNTSKAQLGFTYRPVSSSAVQQVANA
jgi:hypothetical protein